MSYDEAPPEQWELLVDPVSGVLERPLEGETWSAFGDAVQIVEGEFRVDHARVVETVGAVRATSGMLEQFVSLSTHPDPTRATGAFAGRWGLLDLCDHWLPMGHPALVPASVGLPDNKIGLDRDCESMGPANGSGQPVIAMLFWSEQLRALLNLIARLRYDTGGRTGDWKVVRSASPWSEVEGYDDMFSGGIFDQPSEAQIGLRGQRGLVARSISEFLNVADVGVGLTWNVGPARIGTSGGGLFGALWQQVMLATGDDGGTALCAGCGTRHNPRRSGPVSYCRSCRDRRVPNQRASRRRREKMRLDPDFMASERQRQRDYRLKIKNVGQTGDT